MKVVAILQARMGSTRLPGKVMMDLAGAPMLARCIARIQRANSFQKVVVATTILPADDKIEQLCAENNWLCFRGSEIDVLDRYYKAAISHSADAVVRLTSDCPLLEPEVIDQVVQAFIERQPELEYASNVFPYRTFPHGLDTEVIRFDALERTWREDNNLSYREHVTPYIHRNSDRFRIENVLNDIDYSSMRWTVDTAEDFTFVSRIYDHFGNNHFSWKEVLALLEQHKNWLEFNQHIVQKKVP